jgi:hypothetical protein
VAAERARNRSAYRRPHEGVVSTLSNELNVQEATGRGRAYGRRQTSGSHMWTNTSRWFIFASKKKKSADDDAMKASDEVLLLLLLLLLLLPGSRHNNKILISAWSAWSAKELYNSAKLVEPTGPGNETSVS